MPDKEKYSPELQSMRGIAALVVLLAHCLGVLSLPAGPVATLRDILNGSGCVPFFFILSGVVLSISLHGKPFEPAFYGKFLGRRLFRILPMLMVAAVLGTVYCNLIDDHVTYVFTTASFSTEYKTDIDAWRFAAALIGYSARPDPPTWSIFVELVGSAFIPLMVAFAKSGWSRCALGAFLFAVFLWDPPGFQYAWPIFLIHFYIGVSLVWWGPAFSRAVGRLPMPIVIGVIIGLLAIFSTNRIWWPAVRYRDVTTNLIELGATAPIIALGLYAPVYFGLLRHRSFIFLGDLSYSVYLLHFPILCLLVQLLANSVPAQVIASYPSVFSLLLAVLTGGLTLTIARATYQRIELPFIAFGRRAMSRSGPAVKAA